MKLTNLDELNYVSVLLVSPSIKIGNIEYNKNLILKEIEKNANNTNLLVFPELCLTGSTYYDYFLNDNLSKEINEAIFNILEASYEFHSTIILGTCGYINNKLLNAALFISDGKLLGVVPKMQQNRWFCLPDVDSFMLNGYDVKISSNLIFQSFCKIGICFGMQDISSLPEAEIIVCLDSMPYIFNNKNDEIIKSISKITNQGIIYVSSNTNESTADNVYDSKLFAAVCGK